MTYQLVEDVFCTTGQVACKKPKDDNLWATGKVIPELAIWRVQAIGQK